MLDVTIIGGGPAGLSAALVLGRCRRRVLVIDAEEARNRWAREVHGYLTRDCTPPEELRALGRADVERYGVTIVRGTVDRARRDERGVFQVRYREREGGAERTVESLTLLLATGVRDELPALPGIEQFYGAGVHHCPYCDGWEHRDGALVGFGDGDDALGIALSLRTWSAAVTACTNGAAPSRKKRDEAEAMGIVIREEKVARLEGEGDRIRRVVLAAGEPVECDALFFNTSNEQRSDLPEQLGCAFGENGGVKTDDRQCTGVEGLYLAGDAAKDVQFAIVAAGEGAVAATAINHRLQTREIRLAIARAGQGRLGIV